MKGFVGVIDSDWFAEITLLKDRELGVRSSFFTL
jgi:hypothetical protein